MKKSVAAFLCAALLLSLCACGTDAAEPTAEPDARSMLSAANIAVSEAGCAETSSVAEIILTVSGTDSSFVLDDHTKCTGRGTDEFAYSTDETLSINGSVSTAVKLIYIDGVCYASDSNGKYKELMTADEFNAYLNENTISIDYDLDAMTDVSFVEPAADSAAPSSAEPSVAADLEITYSGAGTELLGGLTKLLSDGTLILDEDSSSLSGTAILTSDGAFKSDTYTLTCTGTYGDQPVSLNVRIQNKSVDASETAVEQPSSIADYRTVSDIRIPSVFLSLYPKLAAETALSFSVGSEWTFTVDSSSDSYKSYYEGSIVYGDTLSFVLSNNGSLNDQTWTSEEKYSDGILDGVYNGVAESVSEYTDDDFTTTLLTIYYAYPISWDNVKNVTMTEKNGITTFEFDYTDDYVGVVISNCYAYLYDFDDLTSYATSSNITDAHSVVTVNTDTGKLLNHSFSIVASYNINNLILNVSANFELNVTAVGSDVVIPSDTGSATVGTAG